MELTLEQGKTLGDLVQQGKNRAQAAADRLAVAKDQAKTDYGEASRIQQEHIGGNSCAAAATVIDQELGAMRGLLLVGLGLLLAGCAYQEPEVRTVRVEVAVPVPCNVAAVQIPSFATAGLKRADSLETKVRALLAEIRQRQGYEKAYTKEVSTPR